GRLPPRGGGSSPPRTPTAPGAVAPPPRAAAPGTVDLPDTARETGRRFRRPRESCAPPGAAVLRHRHSGTGRAPNEADCRSSDPARPAPGTPSPELSGSG